MKEKQKKEFVLLDRLGNELDWVDPYLGHELFGDKIYVENGLHRYELSLENGRTFIIRELWSE